MTTVLEQRCADTLDAVRRRERARELKRLMGPTIRIFDGNMNTVEVVRAEDEIDFTEVENDSAAGVLKVDGELPIAQWLWDLKGRKDRGETIDVFIAVDYVGWRWGGRLEDCVLRSDELGNPRVDAIFEHDYAELKARDLWATPSTPAGFQPFKIFMLAGPSDWAAGTALWLNLARAHGNPVGWSGDPISNKTANYQNWPIVVEPFSYAQAVARGTPTGLVLSRFKTWHDACQQMLNDAQITVRVRRYLPGDPLPWIGANIAYGTLVVSFDNTGADLASATSGSLVSGIGQMVRIFLSSVIEGLGGGSLPIESGEQPITGQPPVGHEVPGQIGQISTPYVLYTARSPGLVECEAHLRPAKYKRLTAGGHSAPMVNEVISASIQAIGDALAALPFAPIPPLGGVADALLKPFYTDVILAFMTVYLAHRAAFTSRFGPYELFVEGADQAYTLASTMVMRTAVNATATQFTASMKIIDGAPWWVGAPGDGDMWVGTRVLMQVPGDKSGRIYSERIKKLQLTAKRGQKPTWDPTIGDLAPAEDALVRAWRRMEQLLSGLKQLGLM